MATSGGAGTTMSNGSIADFYRGRCILITGATGFMGKVLVEKLLRSCPEVDTLYLLMRPKRGQDVKARLNQLLSTQMFDVLRREHPERLRKVEAVSGDITHAQLGLSDAEQRLLAQRVSIVFHSAATVKFDEPLKLSVDMNIRGTQRLVQLARTMTKLEALIHVSTAYCNCHLTEVEEKVYPPPADPDQIIQCCEWMDEDLINSITPKLIGNRPNTYTFTKALAEHALVREAADLPVAIVRPSIVTAAWREPIPGWVDNLNGPTGMIAGAGKGVLRSILCYRDYVADLVPVDVCINLMLAVAWNTATSRPREMMVYNCTSGSIQPIKWREVENWGYEFLIKHPFNDVLWYPAGSFKSSRLLNTACVLAFHIAPALLMDWVAKISGKKPIMMRVQDKLQRAVGCLEFFTTHQWQFSNDHVIQLANQLSPRDRQEFNFDLHDLNWRDYLENYVLGVRKFVLKEDLTTLPAAKRHLSRMYWLHQASHVLTLTLAWRLIMLRSESAQQIWAAIVAMFLRIARSLPLPSILGGH